MIIGIVGKIASGKSNLINILNNRYKYKVLELDKIANEIINNEYYKIEILMSSFGEKDFTRDNYRNLFFNNLEFKIKVEKLVHPKVKIYCRDYINKYHENNNYIFIESAILLNLDYDDIIDEYWEVYCDEGIRKNRLIERGLSNELIKKIDVNQLISDENLKKIKYRIKSNNYEEIEKQLLKIL